MSSPDPSAPKGSVPVWANKHTAPGNWKYGSECQWTGGMLFSTLKLFFGSLLTSLRSSLGLWTTVLHPFPGIQPSVDEQNQGVTLSCLIWKAMNGSYVSTECQVKKKIQGTNIYCTPFRGQAPLGAEVTRYWMRYRFPALKFTGCYHCDDDEPLCARIMTIHWDED